MQHDQARAAGPAQRRAQPGRVQDEILDGAPLVGVGLRARVRVRVWVRVRVRVRVTNALPVFLPLCQAKEPWCTFRMRVRKAPITTLSAPATPSAAVEGIARLACSRSMRSKRCVQSADVRASAELKFLVSDACDPKVHALGPFAEGSMR